MITCDSYGCEIGEQSFDINSLDMIYSSFFLFKNQADKSRNNGVCSTSIPEYLIFPKVQKSLLCPNNDITSSVALIILSVTLIMSKCQGQRTNKMNDTFSKNKN